MDLRRLKTFVTVAENGTVSKAAEILHITQPALSRQLAGLEQELGFALFERAGRRLLLTPRGDQFLGDCRSLLAHAGTLSERALALGRGDIRVLRVAASALTIEGAFPGFLRSYAEGVPGVQLITIEQDDPAEQLAMLDRGHVHLAVNVVNFVTVDDRFASRQLPSFEVLAACAPSLGLDGGTADIRRLAGHPLLLPNASFATRTIFDAACRLAGVKPRVVLESRAAHALLALARAGHGVAIVPSILRPDPEALAVMRVFHREQPLQIHLAVLWDKRRTPQRHAETFAELLAAHIREAFPDPATGTPTPHRRRRA
jgi:DNA-binding transcriptional LysR family regulator